MFRALRGIRTAQLALLVAGVLAVSGSFGLHPEPGASTALAAHRPGWNALDRSAKTETHDCYLCLAHRSVSLPRLSPVVLQSGSAVCARPVVAPAPLGR